MKKLISQQKITTCLWFDTQAAEAVDYYLRIFKDAQKGIVTYYGKEDIDIHGMPEGTELTIAFTLEGQSFLAMNGGPHFQFTPAISLVVNCDTQEEIDYYWQHLIQGGDEKAQMCGWLKDKYGLSWQIVPTILPELLQDPDETKSGKVMQAIHKMKKLDIAALQAAYHQ
ncbi:VOC family protein [Chitinophaga nivalis]|uniref:VOC family protein n=1 Tax=Chitinophaga nivalis TaxID=2991709 RepID=A0ABT3IL31_9BACT|nr:VOC family protein [Chitinophaga nivalis]MCW3465814.1 VOC family protein [Chitinophaga nivalis]MCW3484495.1 VOC family protein [Chitinophaga nivalis]